MNKKIVGSLAAIAAVAAVAGGATVAYFSDVETSTGNTFAAGAVDLKVDSDCHYYQLNENNEPVDVGCSDLAVDTEHGKWEASDLGAEYKFFNFSDIKPGDSGEDTVSLHVDNDAWLRLVIEDIANNGNGLTEPEDIVDGDADGQNEGELLQNLIFSIWLDEGNEPGFQCEDGNPECDADITEGDNVKQVGEPALISEGTLDANGETLDLSLAEYGSQYLMGGETAYFGIAWKLPSSVGNIVQGDSLSATMVFEVQQYRNNPSPTWSNLTID